MDRQSKVREPHEHPRRVLFMASGLTPQVVTETLYALAVERDPPFVPTEVIVLTTAEGARRARQALFADEDGRFATLCREFGLVDRIRFTSDDIHIIGADTRSLEDLRTAADLAVAADAITGTIRDLCADPDCAVHASIAGGRKSMSYYVGQALSLFGREQDRLSHVLVSAPFESLPDFYYPPRVPRDLPDRHTGELVSTGDARVELAEIPFVRLRHGLPAGLLQGSASFSDTVAAVVPTSLRAQLRFGVAPCAVMAAGCQVQLPPMLYAWYAMFARRAIEASTAAPATVRHVDLDPGQLLREYADAAGRMSDGLAVLEEQLRRDQGVAEAFFREKNAKLNRRLREALGVDAGPYLIRAAGRRPVTRYGLLLPSERIEGLEALRGVRIKRGGMR